MNKIDNNKAFQEILKNAPDMPQPEIPDGNPKPKKGNLHFIISMAVMLIGQVGTIIAIYKLRKTMLANNIPASKPKDSENENSSSTTESKDSESEKPPTLY
ncbi:MAG: hypothetical protein FGM46_08345 [Ferruginibacter sp.]|nr:hypothetical protein [Ferruginibacter sp.]